MAATRIVRTFGSGNQKKFTASFWIKLSRVTYTDSGSGASRQVFGQTLSNYCRFMITGSTRKIQFYESQGMDLRPSQTLSDFHGWYHIVVAVDTAQATASNRVKMYINGEQVTSFSTETYPAQNADLNFNKSGTHDIGGSSAYGGYDYFDGYYSHFHFSDGYVYAASDFGSTDSTTGEWKINTSPSITYGTNGFFIFKDNASLTDQSGNSNNWTVSTGSIQKSEDCPSNVFCTLNPLNYTSSAITYSNGNNKATYPGAWMASLGTIGAKAGKYYWEAKVVSGNNANLFYGISTDAVDLDTAPQNKAGVISQHINGDRYVDTTYTAGAAQALVNGDILGVALDLDSSPKTVKFYKNGSLLTSSSSVNLTSTFDDEFVFPIFIGNNSSASSIWEVNFGNGFFGTTQISSEGTNASGIGKFEYDVPANHTALCTKGLNE